MNAPMSDHAAGARRLDLNADLGEGVPDEALVMPHVTSANIACGGHAGDAATMRASLRLAREHGVAAGAHPGFADREHFGRRELPVTPDEAYDLVLGQTRALLEIANELGVPVAHVKPHGALYNMAARDVDLARAIARAVRDSGVGVLYGLAGNPMITAAREFGLRAVGEAFADRGYQADGTLVPRGQPGALLGHEAALAQALRIAGEGRVTAADGREVTIDAGTLCLHGDGADAVSLVRALRGGLTRAGIDVRAP